MHGSGAGGEPTGGMNGNGALQGIGMYGIGIRGGGEFKGRGGGG